MKSPDTRGEKKEEAVEIEELDSWGYLEDRFLDILNKKYQLDKAIEDIKSFRNTKWYTGTKARFKTIKRKRKP